MNPRFMPADDVYGENGDMVIAAVRYCLGRSTYIVSSCEIWLHRNWASLPEYVRKIIQRDVETAFADAERHPNCLGMDCDKRSWERVRALWLKCPACSDEVSQ